MSKGILERFVYDRGKDEPHNGDRELEAVILSSTPNKKLLEVLKSHIEESNSQREEILTMMRGLIEGVKQQLQTFLEEESISVEKRMDDVTKVLDSLEVSVSALSNQILDREIYQDLSEELDKYKDNWLFKDKKPAIDKLIMLFDDLGRTKDGPFPDFQDRVLGILNSLNVQKVEKDPIQFNPEFQDAVKTIEVNDDEKDSQVDAVLREGFKYRERLVVRPQKVSIFKHNPQEVDSNEGRHNGN